MPNVTEPYVTATHINCALPHCNQTWELPVLEEIPPALADLFSMTPRGMAESRALQRARQIEVDLGRHFRTHQPEEYLTELRRLALLVIELGGTP